MRLLPIGKFGDIGGKYKAAIEAVWKARKDRMIPVTKEQAAYLRQRLPGVCITTLCRKKSKGGRKRRLVEEYLVVQMTLRAFEQSKKMEGGEDSWNQMS